MVLCSVRDCVAESFGSVVTFPSVGVAKREFADLCRDQNTAIGKHPSDFKLYHLANYSEIDGRIIVLESPCILVDNFATGSADVAQ